MAIHELSFLSYNGRDTVKGWCYTPIAEPRGIVQVVHGFGEHSRRYLHLILQLLDSGFVVCADDHVGHGKTAADAGTWGDYGFKGYATTTEDEHTLHGMMTKKFPGLPYFFFGHSWGSMITRDYLAKYGSELSGAILCGTVALLDQVQPLRNELRELVNAGKGTQVIPEYLGKLLGNFTARYQNPQTPNDWIAVCDAVVADHAADPFNNFTTPPNVQAMLDFVELWCDICSEQWAEKVPNLPLYLIAGDQDPVGNFGQGVYETANWLWNTGKTQIKTQIYSGYRHEIHNEPNLRADVEQGILAFLEACLDDK